MSDQVVCSQCGRPPLHIYRVKGGGEIVLCLDCSLKYQRIVDMQVARAERQLNFISDQAAFVVGLPSVGPRYPERPRPVEVSGMTLNNIQISGGTVGVLNAGSIQRVDVAIGAIQNGGDTALAAAIKELTEAIATSSELRDQQKNDALEMLDVVAAEATQPKEKRRTAVAKPVLGALAEIIKVGASLATLWGDSVR
jgi:hypothetical protein